jgi:hypothetical protein
MKLFTIFLLGLLILNDCPSEEQNFRKVMTPQFAEELEECIITTRAEFIGMGAAGMRIPNKLKGKVVFRCVSPGEQPEKNQLSGQDVGFFCFGTKENTELLFDLKRGDLIQLKGKVWVNNYMGYKQSNFIIESISKLEP